MKRNAIIALGIAATLAETALWHGPLGAAERLTSHIESTARAELVHLEMPLVNARLERRPLRRRLILSGPADDFQHGELVRIMNEIPGVTSARWATSTESSDGEQ